MEVIFPLPVTLVSFDNHHAERVDGLARRPLGDDNFRIPLALCYTFSRLPAKSPQQQPGTMVAFSSIDSVGPCAPQ
jgi:hypothetical protein